MYCCSSLAVSLSQSSCPLGGRPGGGFGWGCSPWGFSASALSCCSSTGAWAKRRPMIAWQIPWALRWVSWYFACGCGRRLANHTKMPAFWTGSDLVSHYEGGSLWQKSTMISFRIGFASTTLATPVQTPRPSAACFATVRSTPWVTGRGGNFHYTPNGIKDCTHCLRPHIRENYSKILEKMPEILELAKKDRGRGLIGNVCTFPAICVGIDCKKRPNWPPPAGANSYTFADGEGGGICPRFLARKQGFATDPFSFMV